MAKAKKSDDGGAASPLGLVGGAAAGAAAGSLLGPLGAAVGALVGGVAGSQANAQNIQEAGAAVKKQVTSVVSSKKTKSAIKKPLAAAATAVKKVAKKPVAAVKKAAKKATTAVKKVAPTKSKKATAKSKK